MLKHAVIDICPQRPFQKRVEKVSVRADKHLIAKEDKTDDDLLEKLCELSDLLNPANDPCELEVFATVLQGPGTFTDSDFGATGPITSISFVADTDAKGVTITGVNGEPVPLICGSSVAYSECVDPVTGAYCEITGYTVEISDASLVTVHGLQAAA